MAAATNKYTSIAGHFDGHAEVLKQYMRHSLIGHAHGYPGSHQMLPLGKYSCCIAPEAIRAIANKATIKKCTTFPSRFDGHGNAPV